jgi:hypothetical protein
MKPDTDFVTDRIEDALDGGTVDAYAREHLLSALAELDAELAAKRRTRADGRSGETIRGP